MKYGEDSRPTIRERPQEVRGKGALKGIAGEALKVPERTLKLGTSVRRRAQNMTSGIAPGEEIDQREATEQMLENDAADLSLAGKSAVSTIGRRVRKEIGKSKANRNNSTTADGGEAAGDVSEATQETARGNAQGTVQRSVQSTTPGNAGNSPVGGTSGATSDVADEALQKAAGQIRTKPSAAVLHEKKGFTASHIRQEYFELRGARASSGAAARNTAGRIEYEATVQMKRTHLAAKQSAENAKQGAKKLWDALKASSKAVIRAARSAAAAFSAAIGAGGIAIIACVLILCMGAGILASPFGLFAHFETNNGDTPLAKGAVSLNTAIEEINKEYTDRIEELAKGKTDSIHIAVDGNDEDYYMPQNWADVLAVFAVKVALDPEDAMDIITLDKTRVALLREIFWDMNKIEYHTEQEVYTEQVTDPNTGQVTTVQKTRTILSIEGSSSIYTEMITRYHFTKDQEEVLNELTGSEFWPYWRNIVNRSLGGADEDWSGSVVNPVGGMKIPVLYQYNYKKTVCTINGSAKSVSTSGCGATSASMAIAYLTGNTTQTPYTLFKWAYDTGRYHGDGLDHDTVSKMCSNYGVKCTWVSNTESNVLNALRNGYPVIAHMGPGIFTKAGHYIVLRGVTEDGLILVNDPNSAQRTKMAFPLSTIIKQLRRANCIGVCKLAS